MGNLCEDVLIEKVKQRWEGFAMFLKDCFNEVDSRAQDNLIVGKSVVSNYIMITKHAIFCFLKEKKSLLCLNAHDTVPLLKLSRPDLQSYLDET